MSGRRGIAWLLPAAVFALALLVAPAAQAGWLAPVDISDAGEQVGSPHVVLDSHGNATAVWDRWSGRDTVVESAYRPAGEAWKAPVVISDAEDDAQSPRIAVDAAGDVTVVWERYGGTNRLLIQSVQKPAGGSWQSPVKVGEVNTMMDPEPWVAVDAHGDATATWTAGGTVYSAYEPAGEGWQSPVELSGVGYVPQAAVDEQGDATVVWLHYNGSTYGVQSVYRPAGASPQAPTELTEPGEEGGDPQIALDAHGDTMVAWVGHPSEYEDVARVAYRPAGGAWQAPVTISEKDEQVQSQTMRIALDAQGDAMVAWTGSTREVGQYGIAHAAYRPSNGAWEAPKGLSEDGGNAFPSDLAFDAAGNAAILWQRNNGTNNILQADYRPAGGTWQVPTDLSKVGSNAMDAVLVLDAPGDATTADGDATAVWISGNDGGCRLELHCVGSYLVQAAGYDTHESPSQGLEVPATGTVGTPVEVSVPTEDAYSPVLEFGDGTSSSGDAGTAHTYTYPGVYTVTFSSTELLGYRTSVQRTIAIGDSSGSQGSSPGSGGKQPILEGEHDASKPGTGALEPDRGSPTQGSGPMPDSSSSSGGGTPAGAMGTVTGHGTVAKGLPLILELKWGGQSRSAILSAGRIRVMCHLNAPGVCRVRGAAGQGRATIVGTGSQTIAVKLTRVALKEIRAKGRARFTFLVTAGARGRGSVSKTITVSVS